MSDYTLHNGDCLEYMKSMQPASVDCVVTDPPYGMDADCDYSRFSGGSGKDGRGSKHERIVGDDAPFDPTPFLGFREVILFGFNHFPSKLPAGGALVWLKRNNSAFGTFMSDAEIAWIKGRQGVHVFREVFAGSKRAIEAGVNAYAASVHPTQKPIDLMMWCIEKVSKEGDTVFDPYMGSGTTGVACMKLGRKFIGCEIVPKYFAIAERRIKSAALQPGLFTPSNSGNLELSK
jgi:site-specific DNA-methyltransferase (adenine-specific)